MAITQILSNKIGSMNRKNIHFALDIWFMFLEFLINVFYNLCFQFAREDEANVITAIVVLREESRTFYENFKAVKVY